MEHPVEQRDAESRDHRFVHFYTQTHTIIIIITIVTAVVVSCTRPYYTVVAGEGMKKRKKNVSI